MDKTTFKKKILYILLDIGMDPQTGGVSYDDIVKATDEILELFDKTRQDG